ncbi:MAG: hypothetical protein ACKOXB_03640 [Flavobacteriales bacterium]
MKKSNYDIKTNPRPISEKDIEKHMNFDNALETYSHWVYRHPWYRFQRHSNRNYRIVLYIILFAVIAGLVLMEVFK